MINLNQYADQLCQEVTNHLCQNEDAPLPLLARLEKATELCQQAVLALREKIIDYQFTGNHEEIQFFKETKPNLMAHFFYYFRVYELHAGWPSGGEDCVKEYLRKALYKIQQFFEENHDFYIYYRTNCTDRDERYFVRSGKKKVLLPVNYIIGTDPFSTGYDLLVANILANDKLQLYLQKKQNEVSESSGNSSSRSTVLSIPWTGSKTSLIELIHSLHEEGVLKDGSVTLRELIEFYEQKHAIDLSDAYRLWHQVKNRKNEPVLFLHKLAESLRRRIQRSE